MKNKEFNKQLNEILKLLSHNSKEKDLSFNLMTNGYRDNMHTINYDGNCFYGSYEVILDEEKAGTYTYHFEFYGKTVDELKKNYEKAVKRMKKYMKARKLKQHTQIFLD